MDIRKRIEQNPVIVFLSVLVVGFVSGVGAVRVILEVANFDTDSQTKIERMQKIDDELSKTKEQLEKYKLELKRLKENYAMLMQDESNNIDERVVRAVSKLEIWVVYTTEYLQEAVEIKKRISETGATIALWHLEDYVLRETKDKLIQFNPASAEGVAAVKAMIADIYDFNLESVSVEGESNGRKPLSEIIFELNRSANHTIGSVPTPLNITTDTVPTRSNEVLIWIMPKELYGLLQ
ncbi:hypothetical protein [Saccharospirillum salsuginis]|uniref:Uncharacterized protein n=1 Tax=Saccharospirillum salsuginis TaxID=418750 RepID=A0A918K0Q1_9GAMM|nr:hypothetical protein [Saccharospirillum salsuginis]GGX40058.1 hypothetical protein GCM10007392_03320 [Saccharospirillum salsuginis]